MREQSASAQGASFAGSAAGFDLSSMYWNPAAVTSKDGTNSESHASLILGQFRMSATGGALNNPLVSPGTATYSPDSGNSAAPALVSSSYVNYQFGNFYLGLSINAPFGLTTKPEREWQGQSLGRTSKLLTVNAAPTVGYKIMPGISIAVGAQIQYIDAKLSSVLAGTPSAALGALTVEGDDIGYGFTAGVMLEPTSSTKIGLGFRSSVSHTLEGDQKNNLTRSNITAEVDLPEIVTLSLRQRVNPRLTFLGTIEWTNWSRIQSIDIKCATVDGVACVANGQTLSALELNYDDGWFFAGGMEYAVSPSLLVRTGLAYEVSPARDATSRTVRIADNDRIWASIGATYQWNEHTAFDVAYSHVFVKDGEIIQGATPVGPALIADVESSADILSASMKIKW